MRAKQADVLRQNRLHLIRKDWRARQTVIQARFKTSRLQPKALRFYRARLWG